MCPSATTLIVQRPCRPKFQPPQSEGAGRGLVPFWGRGEGANFFLPPPPPLPNRHVSGRVTEPPPPSTPFALSLKASTWRTRSVPSRKGERALDVGTHMVTQQVLLSRSSGDDEQMNKQCKAAGHLQPQQATTGAVYGEKGE